MTASKKGGKRQRERAILFWDRLKEARNGNLDPGAMIFVDSGDLRKLAGCRRKKNANAFFAGLVRSGMAEWVSEGIFIRLIRSPYDMADHDFEPATLISTEVAEKNLGAFNTEEEEIVHARQASHVRMTYDEIPEGAKKAFLRGLVQVEDSAALLVSVLVDLELFPRKRKPPKMKR